MMKALVFKEPGIIKIEEIPIPDLKPNEVLVKIRSVGICGSDIHFCKNGYIGDLSYVEGDIPGHEASGIVEKIGECVKTKKVGDRVIIEPGIPCGKCDFCRKGRYNLCDNAIFYSNPSMKGFFSEYVAVPEDFAYGFPDSISFEEGALIEPLAVTLQALKRSDYELGKSILILGSGPIGLLMFLTAKAAGASRVFLTDIEEYRIKFAKKIGATEVFNANDSNYINEILEKTDFKGADIIFETSASKESYKMFTNIVNKGGVIVTLTIVENNFAEINTNDMIFKELKICASHLYTNNEFKNAIGLVSNKIIDVNKIITHRFPFSEIENAFNLASSRKDNVIKVVINF